MRAIICGDTHIGAVFGLGGPNGAGGNTRVDDYENSLNSIIDYAIETKADIFIQTGDLFEHRNPAPEHIKIVDKAFKRLSNANIATFVIMGNHDYKKTGSTFTSSISSLSSSEYPNVRMLLEPEVIQFHNSENQGVNLLLVPYRDKRMYKGDSVKEQSDAYNDHIREMMSSISNDDPVVAVGHNFFYEGSYNDYGGAEVLANPLAFSGADAVFMGHLHQYRILRKHAPVCVYTGSMEKTNFGEAGVDKYYIDYNILSKKARFCKTKTRELIDETIDLTHVDFSDVQAELKDKIDSYDMEDKIVRLKVLANEKVMPALDKAKISSIIYNNKAFYLSKVIIEPVAKRIVRDSEILKHKDDHSMFEAFIDSQDLDSEFKDALLKEASIIMGEI
tara:strand:+ start:6257 stop:7426 length:1170 start_codon:yes stop_codon:yes gene_type:complete